MVTELTFVLLLVVSGERMEFTPYSNLSECLSTRRKIERNVGRYQKDFNKRWTCKELKVRMQDGEILEIVE
jgi:hypothetical protein